MAVGELEGVDGGRPYCTADGVGAVLAVFHRDGLTGPVTRRGQRQPGLPGHPVRRHLRGRAGRVRQARRGLLRAAVVTPIRGDAPGRPGRARRRGHRQRQRPRPAHQPGVRRAAGRPGRPGARHRPGRGHAAGRRAHRPAGPSASSASPASTCWSSTWPSTEQYPGPRLTTARPSSNEEEDRPWHADSCGSTSAPRPASARPTRCSSEAHRRARARHRRGRRLRRDPRPAAHRGACSTAWRSCPAGRSSYRGADVHRDGRRRGARPRARGRAGRRAGPHQRARLAATRSAGRTSRSCSTPASTCITTVNIQHLESLNDVVEQITGVAAARDRARRGGPRGPTRSSWST